MFMASSRIYSTSLPTIPMQFCLLTLADLQKLKSKLDKRLENKNLSAGRYKAKERVESGSSNISSPSNPVKWAVKSASSSSLPESPLDVNSTAHSDAAITPRQNGIQVETPHCNTNTSGYSRVDTPHRSAAGYSRMDTPHRSASRNSRVSTPHCTFSGRVNSAPPVDAVVLPEHNTSGTFNFDQPVTTPSQSFTAQQAHSNYVPRMDPDFDQHVDDIHWQCYFRMILEVTGTLKCDNPE